MTSSSSSRDLWALVLPIAAGLMVVAAGPRFVRFSASEPEAGVVFLLLLLMVGVAGAFHRPFGATTLGLGAAILPAAVVRYGVGPALGLAAASLLLSDLAWRSIRSGGSVPLPERRRLWRSIAGAGRVAVATFAAAVVLRGLPRWRPELLGLWWIAAAAFLAYSLVWLGFEVGEAKIRRPEGRLRPALAYPLSVDLVGWTSGVALAAVGWQTSGWGLPAVLFVLYAVLALECGRNGILFEKMRRRARDLERLRRAGRRIVTVAQEMEGVVERIHAECKVVKCLWFQFEALTPGSEFKSWWAGPEGAVQEGIPVPDLFPPALPGFHRRSNWQVIERVLRIEGGKVIARIRLWCDPRVLDLKAIAMLDGLLPQMTVSVQRCLLDREAREDPLTGVAVRRFLEPRLHELHAQAIEEGHPLSVILCDLDHFKRINDTYGHPVGDRALIAVAEVLKAEHRETDLLCRYGGEEFVLVLEKTTGGTAMAIAERIRKSIEALELKVEEQRIPMTMSFGVAAFPELYIKTAAELILFSDEALYEAKRQGRNRCLLDLGQGRYMNVQGDVHVADDAAPVQAAAAPRIFA